MSFYDIPNHKVGDRVGAILGADDDGSVRFFGYGTYEGEVIPPKEVSPDHHDLSIPNPCIRLDSGKMVWGFECWWGSADKIKIMLGDQKVTKIVMIDPDEFRRKRAEVADQEAGKG